jgi:hypothetical protein
MRAEPARTCYRLVRYRARMLGQPLDRPGLTAAIGACRSGDTLVVRRAVAWRDVTGEWV